MMYLGQDPVGLATSIPTFGDIAKVAAGTYTPTTDEVVQETFFPNPLGEVFDFFIWGTDNFVITNTPNVYAISGCIFYKRLKDENYKYYIVTVSATPNNTTPTITRGSTSIDEETFSQQIRFFAPTNGKLKANTAYHYIIGKFKEVTSNANE